MYICSQKVMAQAQILLTDESEAMLKEIRKIAIINGLEANNKQDQVNTGLKWLAALLRDLHEDTVMNILNLKQ